ncbi:DUF2214 family protein [Gallaecimonas mangrovi]|uniref:DUF2214 family protein n=1 Tax=Gallaecimonas mangrovi TaxID=2291597 RepID=UPI000E1FE755|nr:DUF2214 family protein [Gallaecimonas mangrovi]
MDDIFFRYLHFLGMLVMMAALVCEHMLLSPTMTATQLKKLARLDIVYGISALVVFIAGISLWFWVGKPAAFYSQNWVFHLKVTLFVLILALSILPSLFFIRASRSGAETVALPKVVIMLVRTEMLVMLIIPLLAVLMAKGVGLSH